MADAEHPHQCTHNYIDLSLFSLSCFVQQRELQRLPNVEGREMLVIFWVVIDFASIMSMLFAGGNATIRNIARHL